MAWGGAGVENVQTGHCESVMTAPLSSHARRSRGKGTCTRYPGCSYHRGVHAGWPYSDISGRPCRDQRAHNHTSGVAGGGLAAAPLSSHAGYVLPDTSFAIGTCSEHAWWWGGVLGWDGFSMHVASLYKYTLLPSITPHAVY